MMILLVLAYLGGALTILSPCILPVLPFVFAGSKGRGAIPLLLGMSATFALVSALALLGGAWVSHVSDWGRTISLALLLVFGISLLFPTLLQRLLTPLLQIGGRLGSHPSGPNESPSFSRSFLVGVGTGLLWAPCAGPILGLILTGAASQADPRRAVFLLIAYALGASSSLGLALAAGGRVGRELKKYLGVEEAIRKVMGVAVLFGVVAIFFHWDRALLTRVSALPTDSFEKRLVGIFAAKEEAKSNESVEGPMPELDGGLVWLNSPPRLRADLAGKVVLIDFWTYSCINCLRTLPHVKDWAERYRASGLVVIGVHAPEFAFEKNRRNVEDAVRELGISYPVALDNNHETWRRFKNKYWPAHYFVDRRGFIRHHHFGEGGYEESERVLRELLAENGTPLPDPSVPSPILSGAQAASNNLAVKSPETYLGFERAKNLAESMDLVPDRDHAYRAPADLELNEWALHGNWHVSAEKALSKRAGARIAYRFHARDLHLVLGTASGRPIRFRVRLDGKVPGPHGGTDLNERGEGVIREHRLYQLIRQQGTAADADRSFEIEFLDPDAEAFAFTFG